MAAAHLVVQADVEGNGADLLCQLLQAVCLMTQPRRLETTGALWAGMHQCNTTACCHQASAAAQQQRASLDSMHEQQVLQTWSMPRCQHADLPGQPVLTMTALASGPSGLAVAAGSSGTCCCTAATSVSRHIVEVKPPRKCAGVRRSEPCVPRSTWHTWGAQPHTSMVLTRRGACRSGTWLRARALAGSTLLLHA